MPDSRFQDKVVNFLEPGTAPEGESRPSEPVVEEGVQTIELVKSTPGTGPIVPKLEEPLVEEPSAAAPPPEDATPTEEPPVESPPEEPPVEPTGEAPPVVEPAEETPSEPPEYNLDEEAKFYLTLDGKEEGFTGAQLANATRQVRTLENKFSEVKAKEAAVTQREASVQDNAAQIARRLTGDMLARAGYLRPDGSFIPAPAAGAPEEGAGEPKAEEPFKLPRIDLDKIDSDDLHERSFYEQENARTDAVEKALNTVLDRVSRMAQPAAEPGRSPALEVDARADELIGSLRERLSATEAFGPDGANIEEAVDDVLDLLSMDRNRGRMSVDDAVLKVARFSGSGSGTGSETTGPPPAGRGGGRGSPPPRQPPAAGSLGRTPTVSPGSPPEVRERRGYSRGALSSIDRKERLAKELGRFGLK